MAKGNSINEGTTGICGFTGTGFTSTPVIQNAIQIGGSTSSTLANVTVVDNGVLITNAIGVPSLLANGVTGQVLTATTGSPPSWAAPFSPNQIITEFDDFLGSGALTNSISKLCWFNYSSSFSQSAGVAGHDGIMTSITGGGSLLSLSDTTGAVFPFVFGSGTLSANFVVNIVSPLPDGNNYGPVIGFFDISTPITVTNGAYFTITSGGFWATRCRNAGVSTSVTSSTSASTGWVNLGIQINAAATSVGFYVNGTLIQTTTTNIPTIAVTAGISGFYNNGPVAANQLDLFYYTRTFTTPR